ncbi:MAG TPA: M36 family metallopeptidase [Pyrinomonadaceae bacterium]|nr:M36 family metallopeptidase [Pyrinomonadaceae bacterium]
MRSKLVRLSREGLMWLAAAAAVVVSLQMMPAPAFGQAQILDIHEPLRDVDRRGTVAPTAAQKTIVANLRAAVRWNRFGTPQSLIKYGGFLATGLSSAPSVAARAWIRGNRTLFRLSDAGVTNLELVGETKLAKSSAYVVLFRQRFGNLRPAQDGMIAVGVVGGKIAYASSSAVGDAPTPGAPSITAAAAWLKAVKDIGRVATALDLKAKREENGWTLLDVLGFSHPQRARLVAFPTSAGAVRPAYETIVLDARGGQTIAYTHFIDAQTGAVLFRQNKVNRLAQPQSELFTGSFNPPTPGTCGAPSGPYTAGPGTQSIDVIATADNPVNDIVLNLYFGKPGMGGTVVASQDTGTSPEAIHYAPGAIAPGDYYVEVCLFNDPTAQPLPPFTYTGNITINDVAGGGQVVPYPPQWSFFTANPLLSPTGPPVFNYPDTDTRITLCWEAKLNGVDVPECYDGYELFNSASRSPWDFDVQLNAPTFTTKGNNANSAEAWTAPLTPGAVGQRPVAPDRKYNFPWENVWENMKCSPTNFVPGGNDVFPAAVNLFAAHNRMHDWSYHLGFTERTWNLQQSNFGNRATGGVVNTVNGGEADPETGQVQAGAVDGGAPSYLGRDNANQVTLNDGIPGITNMYLWQPISSAFYAPCVDGDFDMSVIGHEYTHAISNRMVGGPDANLTGAQAGAMGESWGDLAAAEFLNGWAATFPAPYSFPVNSENPFAVGPYVTGNKERGIRNYGMNRNKVLPFTSSWGLNPLNYSDVGYDMTGPQVHADGEIWSATNYDIRQALVAKYHSTHPATNKTVQRRCADGVLPADQCPGNRRWIQIVFDAFLLMQPGVSMLDARDAYLAADLMRFGGANQKELWRVFAQRGMGQFASTAGTDDGDPVPSFESALEASTPVKFVVKDENGLAVKAKVYVGHYEARATPVADTDGATALPATAKFVAGSYDFVVQANGYGHVRFARKLGGTTPVDLVVTMPTNLASTHKGATAAGDGFFHSQLIDDTENSGWVANNRLPDVAGTRVTVDLAGGARSVRRVQVSAIISPSDQDTGPDNSSLSKNRFVALRQFEVWVCNQGANLLNPNCLSTLDAGFTKIYTSPASALPGTAPRPAAPDLILRSFDVPATTATHVQLRVVSNQCTGGPQFQGDQDNDPLNDSDCRSGSASDNTVRAQEFQVFGQAAAVPSKDPVVLVTMTAPAAAPRGGEVAYDIAYNNLGPNASSNAFITDVLPAGLDFVSASHGGVYNPTTRKVVWKLGTVAVGGTNTLRLVARVRATTPANSAILNQAEYTADLTVATPAAAVTLVT